MHTPTAKQPQRPTHISEYADICLRALSAKRLGDRLSVGGALGLLHYLDYRPTHDVDAWWVPSATTEEQQQVLQTIERALQSFGEVQQRAWGDVVSLELVRSGETVFSFQIARRSAQLQPSSPTPWVDVLFDSLPDLVASKMVALVERGAPRDFRDIYGHRDPASRMARRGGCLSPVNLARLPSAVQLAPSASPAVFGPAACLYP